MQIAPGVPDLANVNSGSSLTGQGRTKADGRASFFLRHGKVEYKAVKSGSAFPDTANPTAGLLPGGVRCDGSLAAGMAVVVLQVELVFASFAALKPALGA